MISRVCLFMVILLFTFSCVMKIAKQNRKDPASVNSPSLSETPPSVSGDQLKELLQAVIDLPELQEYYRADGFPDKKPLYILKNEKFLSEPKLTKFGESVVYATCEEIRKAKKPYFEFEKVYINDDRAEVVFNYWGPPLRGGLSFEKQDGKWRVAEKKISEEKSSTKDCR